MQLKITSRMARHCGVVIVASVAVMAWTASAAPPTNITTTVASPEDLTAEIRSLLTSVEDALSTAESHEQRQTQLQRQATQIAIFAQALADHAVESPLKQPAPALRDAALALTRAASHKDAIAQLSHMTQALDGKATGAAAKEVEWSRLAGTSAMMAAMKVKMAPNMPSTWL